MEAERVPICPEHVLCDENLCKDPPPHDERIVNGKLILHETPWNIARVIGIVGAAGQLIGAMLIYIGSVNVLYEASGVKYNLQYASTEVSYAAGLRGWYMVLVGFGCCVISNGMGLAFAILSNWVDAVYWVWPEFSKLDISRYAVFFMGDALVMVACGSFHHSYPHPHNALPMESVDVFEEWVTFYKARFIGSIGTTLLVVGAAIRALSPFVQFTLGERLNVFYWLPCPRCGWEWSKAVEPGQGIPPVLTYYTFCASKERRPQFPWCVTFLHNWLGSFRAHIYPSSFLFLLASIFWVQSIALNVYVPFDSVMNTRFANGTIHFEPDQNSIYKSTTLVTTQADVGFYNDTTYHMYVASILFVGASLLQIISAAAYLGGIVINESATPRNHVHQRGAFGNMCCP